MKIFVSIQKILKAMSENELIIDKTTRNDTPNSGESDVRERLTLHVRKRLSGELQVVVKQETSPSNSSESTNCRKKSKKSKKKSKSGNKHSKKHKVKEETSPVEIASEEQQTTETPDVSDEALSRLQSPAVDIDDFAAEAARESCINNAILNKILNEKKRELFESAEILELLREKMKSAT